MSGPTTVFDAPAPPWAARAETVTRICESLTDSFVGEIGIVIGFASEANVPMLQRRVTDPSPFVTIVDGGVTPDTRHPVGRPPAPGPENRNRAPSAEERVNSATTLSTCAAVGNPVSETPYVCVVWSFVRTRQFETLESRPPPSVASNGGVPVFTRPWHALSR